MKGKEPELPDLEALFPGGLLYTVTECPRCEGEHPLLAFHPFRSPGDYAAWATCPETHEPVPMGIDLT